MIIPIDFQLVSPSGPQTFRVSDLPVPGQSRQQINDIRVTLDKEFWMAPVIPKLRRLASPGALQTYWHRYYDRPTAREVSGGPGRHP